MTKDKISSHEIVELIALKGSISKRAAEEFLKGLFLSIEDALMIGESVKIKQLGTFKLQWIEPRKSVNVRTGEDVVLEGYYKVNFTPEASLKALVNEPFAHLEAVELDGLQKESNLAFEKSDEPIDPLRLFTEQASEISSLISEIQAISINNQVTQQIPTSTDEVSDVSVSVNEFDVESDQVLENNEELIPANEGVEEHSDEKTIKKDETSVAQQNLLISEPKFVAPVFEDVSKSSETDTDTKFNLFMKEVKPLRKRKGGIFLFSLIFVAGGVALWFYNSPIKEFVLTTVENSERFFRPPVVKKIVRRKLVIVHRRYFQQTKAADLEKKDSLQLLFDNERVYTKYIGTEHISKGSRLARMALRYYGSVDFWVYIYEANKSKIPDPNNIAFGTLIRIPKLDARLIDLKNPRCINKAKELHSLYLKK